MWRWVLGIIAFVILALMGTCYAGYRRITSGGNTVVATVPGSPARTFTMLTNRDSLLDWMPEGTTAKPEHHGALQVGDTVRVAATTRRQGASGRAVQVWIVREVKVPDIFAIEALEFDPGGIPHRAFTRRDSVFASGDSTRIISTFVAAPLLTGAESAAASGSAVAGPLLGVAERMRVGASKMQWQNQLQQLGRRSGS
jgi:hypothetical protein